MYKYILEKMVSFFNFWIYKYKDKLCFFIKMIVDYELFYDDLCLYCVWDIVKESELVCMMYLDKN